MLYGIYTGILVTGPHFTLTPEYTLGVDRERYQISIRYTADTHSPGDDIVNFKQ